MCKTQSHTYQEEYTPFMACSCSLQRAGFSYLHALPPHAIEHAMCPGMTCRKRSPTFVYFGVGRSEFSKIYKESKVQTSILPVE